MTKKIKVAVEDLVEGMAVDLEGDEWADPEGNVAAYKYEYQVVSSVDVVNTVGVEFDGGDVVGFPVGHLVWVDLDQSAQLPSAEEAVEGLQAIAADLR